MNILLEAQYKENYGAHDWDGKGQCPQYWKYKGGKSYVFTNAEDFNQVLRYFNEVIAIPNYFSREYVVDITELVVPVEGFRTQFEMDQFENEGQITAYSPRIDMSCSDVHCKWAKAGADRSH